MRHLFTQLGAAAILLFALNIQAQNSCGAWTPFTSTVQNLSNLTVADTSYSKCGQTVMIRMNFKGTSNTFYPYVTLPFPVASMYQSFPAFAIFGGGHGGTGAGIMKDTSGVDKYTIMLVPWDTHRSPNGEVDDWRVSGFYQTN